MRDPSTEIEESKSLGERQQTAFAALRLGKTFPQAAEAAGVGRTTIYRWVQEDPHFRAAYTAWQQEQTESARSRLLKLADKAVEVIEEALERGESAVAVGMLKNLGMMHRARAGTTDPEVLAVQMELNRQKLKYQASEAMVRHLLMKAGMSPKEQRQYIRQHGVMQAPGTAPAKPETPRQPEEDAEIAMDDGADGADGGTREEASRDTEQTLDS